MAKLTQSRKGLIFSMFDQKYTIEMVVEATDVSTRTVARYREEWRKLRNLPKYHRQGANSAA